MRGAFLLPWKNRESEGDAHLGETLQEARLRGACRSQECYEAPAIGPEETSRPGDRCVPGGIGCTARPSPDRSTLLRLRVT